MSSVFLRILSDLGFYLCFAGFIASFFGVSGVLLCIGWFVLSAAGFLSRLLRRTGVLRFLSFAAAAAGLILARFPLAELLVLLPAFVYVVYLGAVQRFEPDRDTQQKIFSVFWKLLLLVTLISLFTKAAHTVSHYVLPMGLITLLSQILLLRGLRHESEVRSSARYQITELLLFAAVAALILFLGSETGTRLLLAGLRGLLNFLSPLLELLLRLFIVVFTGVWWFLGLIGRLLRYLFGVGEDGFDPAQIDTELEAMHQQFEDVQPDELPRAILAGLIVLLVLGVATGLFFLFRWMARRSREGEDPVPDMREERLPGERPKTASSVRERGAVHQVRSAYRRYLKRGTAQGIRLMPSDTTLDIQQRFSGEFPQEESLELRELYLKARYDGHADASDAVRARELLKRMTKRE